jgi:hypothetical protein
MKYGKLRVGTAKWGSEIVKEDAYVAAFICPVKKNSECPCLSTSAYTAFFWVHCQLDWDYHMG